MHNSYEQTFAFIDNARKLEREFAAMGDMETAAILAGIADSEEHYVREAIIAEIQDLLHSNPWDVPATDYRWGL